MTENRLEIIAPEQSEMLKQATISEQRNAAKAACKFAIERTSLSHPIFRRIRSARKRSMW